MSTEVVFSLYKRPYNIENVIPYIEVKKAIFIPSIRGTILLVIASVEEVSNDKRPKNNPTNVPNIPNPVIIPII